MMLKSVAGTNIWLEVPITEMGNSREKEYLRVCGEGKISVLDILLKMRVS